MVISGLLVPNIGVVVPCTTSLLQPRLVDGEVAQRSGPILQRFDARLAAGSSQSRQQVHPVIVCADILAEEQLTLPRT